MSGDNFSEKRSVLGDVTNRPLKRGISSVSGGLGLKSRDGKQIREKDEDENSRFAKQVCLGVENFVKEKLRAQSRVDNTSENHSSGSSFACTGNQIDVSAKSVASFDGEKLDEAEERPNLLDASAIGQGVEGNEDASKDGCFIGSLPDKCSQNYPKNVDEEPMLASNAKESCICPSGALEDHVCKTDSKDIGVGRLASSMGGSSEWSRLPKTQSSRSLELESCVGFKNDGCSNLSVDGDLLKSCSCSFCLKAAHIWSDLHYQDIKGRLAVLKKSQKEANSLAQKMGREKQVNVPDQGNDNRSSKLEFDLMNQWRSLFLNMEDIFVRESNQLQGSYVVLKDLREKCKMDLEKMMKDMPSRD